MAQSSLNNNIPSVFSIFKPDKEVENIPHATTMQYIQPDVPVNYISVEPYAKKLATNYSNNTIPTMPQYNSSTTANVPNMSQYNLPAALDINLSNYVQQNMHILSNKKLNKLYYQELSNIVPNVIHINSLLYPIFHISKVLNCAHYRTYKRQDTVTDQLCYYLADLSNTNIISVITNSQTKFNSLVKIDYQLLRQKDYYYALVSKSITMLLSVNISAFINYYGYSYSNFLYYTNKKDSGKLILLIKPRYQKKYKRKQLVHYQEYLTGRPLFELLNDITEKQLLEYLYQIILSLQLAQNKCNFMHRQLNSKNIVIEKLEQKVLLRYNDIEINTDSVVRLINYATSYLEMENKILSYDNNIVFDAYYDILLLLADLTKFSNPLIHKVLKKVYTFFEDKSIKPFSAFVDYVTSLMNDIPIITQEVTYQLFTDEQLQIKNTILHNLAIDKVSNYELYKHDKQYYEQFDNTLSNTNKFNDFLRFFDLYLDILYYQQYDVTNASDELPYNVLHVMLDLIYSWQTIIYQNKELQYRYIKIYKNLFTFRLTENTDENILRYILKLFPLS